MKDIIEEWRPVVGFEGLYEVSDLGRVKSLNYRRTGKEKILKPKKCNGGYLQLCLSNGKCRIMRMVHRMAAEAFLGECPAGLEVNHLDENKENNRVDNLEYCSRKYNVNYGTRTARMAATNSKPVLQYDLDGNLVKRWPSAREIEQQMGIPSTNITACLKGRIKTTHGYIWRYE